jgi:hypothetical protein
MRKITEHLEAAGGLSVSHVCRRYSSTNRPPVVGDRMMKDPIEHRCGKNVVAREGAMPAALGQVRCEDF